MTGVTVLSDVKRLEQLYSTGFQDAFLDEALRKIIDRQIARDEVDLEQVNKELAEFERRYNLTSAVFWSRFQAGQIDDTADFMEWNVFCKMRERLMTRLRILQGGDANE